jgi:hypothetical protein
VNCSYISLLYKPVLCRNKSSKHLISFLLSDLFIGEPDVIMEEDQQQCNAVSVAIKIPPFWSADPQLWFLQVDALFKTRNITASRTKFNHVVAAISPQTATTVRDIIRNPPREDAYDALKEALIKRNAPTKHNQLQQLLQMPALGDRKPSELLRNMRQLNNDDNDTELFREMFLQRLPKEVRAVLMAIGGEKSLDEMAELADNMIDTRTDSTPQLNEIEQLRDEVAALRHANRSRTTSRGIDNRKATNSSTTAWCWYHTRFGSKARSCVPPCAYTNSGNRKARC